MRRKPDIGAEAVRRVGVDEHGGEAEAPEGGGVSALRLVSPQACRFFETGSSPTLRDEGRGARRHPVMWRADPSGMIDDAVARAAFASLFYRHTWMVLMPTAPQLDRIVWLMDNLAFRWMGITVVDLKARRFHIVQHPRGEPPLRRRGLMQTALLRHL